MLEAKLSRLNCALMHASNILDAIPVLIDQDDGPAYPARIR